MDKNLQEALAAIITKVTAGVETGITFLSNQLPDVIHQLLLWKMLEALIPTVIVTIMWLLFVFWFIPTHIKICKKYADATDQCSWVSLMSYLIILPAMGGIFNAYANLVWLQILVAPKIYLIEYAASLLK